MTHTKLTIRTPHLHDSSRALFTADDAGISFASNGAFDAPPYDVDPNGERFLVVQSVTDEDGQSGITVVENWYQEFAERE